MGDDNKNIIENNSKIDPKVVSSANDLESKLPDFIKPKIGSDYHIAPALGGQALTLGVQMKK